MTELETRQLGIEFERRVQTMIPEKEFIDKLDTETIYSYLNQYQDKLIHDLYKLLDQVPQSNSQTYIETLLNSMLTTYTGDYMTGIYDPKYYTYCGVELPDNFGLYVDSNSLVNSSYRFGGKDGKGTVTNKLVSVKDASKAIPKPQDDMKILREPVVWITEDKRLGAVYDRYTEPISITVWYYRVPNYMNPLTSTACELPMEMFEQLVSGAVDLYVQYVAGAEARKRQLAEQQRQQQKRNNDEE